MEAKRRHLCCGNSLNLSLKGREATNLMEIGTVHLSDDPHGCRTLHIDHPVRLAKNKCIGGRLRPILLLLSLCTGIFEIAAPLSRGVFSDLSALERYVL